MSTRAQADDREPERRTTRHERRDLPDRRRFVRSLALGGAAVAAGAAAVPGDGPRRPRPRPAPPRRSRPRSRPADVRLVNFAISLELAASQLYTDMAGTGKLTGDAAQLRPDRA